MFRILEPEVLFRDWKRHDCGELIGGCERQSGERVFHIRPRIDAELLACHGEAGQYCKASAAIIAAEE